MTSTASPSSTGRWSRLPERFEVTRAPRAVLRRAHGLHVPDGAAAAKPARDRDRRFDADYRDVDLLAVTNLLETQGAAGGRPRHGRNRLDWPHRPLCRTRRRRRPSSSRRPPASTCSGRGCRPGPRRPRRGARSSSAPSAITRRSSRWRSAGAWSTASTARPSACEPSEVAPPTPTWPSKAPPRGASDRRCPFRVTSTNWQESDRLLAGLMTAFGASTTAIPIDGVGRFDGVMLGAFRRPRIEGRFVGDEMRAWGVTWGDVDGDFVVENNYAFVSRARDPRWLLAHGRERAVLARLPATGRRRGDQRARARRDPPRQGLPGRVRARGLRGRRARVGRLPPVRQVHAAVRIRPDGHHAGHRLRRAVRRGRPRRCASRAPACGSTGSPC